MTKPTLAYSRLTGKRYIVTRWGKDGAALTKYEITPEEWEAAELIERPNDA